MNRLATCIAVLVLLILTSQEILVAQDRPAQFSVRAKFDPSRDAAKDIADAVRMAKESKKNILVDVGGEWCIWCHRLDSLYMKNPKLETFLSERYVVVKVNVSKENKNEATLAKYPKVDGYPHLFVLDEDGKVLRSQNTGELEEGKGHSKEKVLAFLQKWARK